MHLLIVSIVPSVSLAESPPETNDFCQKEIFFYGHQFERKLQENLIANYDTGIMYSIDLWKWTKNSTNIRNYKNKEKQGTSTFIIKYSVFKGS